MGNTSGGVICAATVLALLLAVGDTPRSSDATLAPPAVVNLLVPFQADNGLWGYRDAAGIPRILPRFERAEDFQEGYAVAWARSSLGVLAGYLNKSGKWLVAPQYTRAKAFRNGKAHASIEAR